jgi:hypothetical protein
MGASRDKLRAHRRQDSFALCYADQAGGAHSGQVRSVPRVMDIRLADKGCGLRVRPFDRETINSTKQPACLRVVVG